MTNYITVAVVRRESDNKLFFGIENKIYFGRELKAGGKQIIEESGTPECYYTCVVRYDAVDKGDWKNEQELAVDTVAGLNEGFATTYVHDATIICHNFPHTSPVEHLEGRWDELLFDILRNAFCHF